MPTGVYLVSSLSSAVDVLTPSVHLFSSSFRSRSNVVSARKAVISIYQVISSILSYTVYSSIGYFLSDLEIVVGLLPLPNSLSAQVIP